MNVRAVILLCALLMLGGVARAQGFAGLGAQVDGFSVPDQGQVLSFPRDHGPHPDFRIEWWYVTANLTGADGQDYGVQWTLFRTALSPDPQPTGWQTPQIWMGHAGLTALDAHFVAEKFARGGVGQAGAQAAPYQVWIDDWEMAGKGIDDVSLSASGDDFSFALQLKADGPLVLHGDAGYSVKSPQGQASFYYSQPAYQVTGQIVLPSGPVQVTGHAWLDREWSSQPLSKDQVGWDWVSLSFDTGDRLMGFQLRGDHGAYTSGTWIGADGRVTPFGDGVLQMSPLAETVVAGRKVPTRWLVDLPSRDLSVELNAVNPNAWMGTLFPYWEGPVRIDGSHPGRGYLEMTGY